MLRILLQWGFHSHWNKAGKYVKNAPIPNELSLEDYNVARTTGILKNRHIGAYFPDTFKYKFITLADYHNDVAYFPIEIKDIYETLLIRSIFGLIRPEILPLLQDKNCNLRLLIWFPTEGFAPKEIPEVFKWIWDSINTLEIPYEKCYFISGDLNIKRNWNAPINVFGMNYFETSYGNNVSKDKFITESEFTTSYANKKSKYFLYLNHQPRQHRINAFALANARNLLKHSYFSFTKIPPEFEIDHLPKSAQAKFSKIQRLLPFVLDKDQTELQDVSTQWQVNKPLMADTHFSFVTETIVRCNALFITEKTYKCISNFHPFIVYGPTKILALLRSNGYKTFPFLFDERYDDIYDENERLDFILDQLELVCSGAKDDVLKSDELKEVLIHNQQHFWKRQGEELRRVYHYLTTHNKQ